MLSICLFLIFLGSIPVNSTLLSLNGSDDYFVNGVPFTLTCTSDIVAPGNTTLFYKDETHVFSVRLFQQGCYGTFNNASSSIRCNDTLCSCSTDAKKFTWTYTGIIMNKTVIFGCGIKEGVQVTQISLSVSRAYGPSLMSHSLNRSSVLVNEGQQLGPVKCTADCVPDCIYKWDGPGISSDMSILQINKIQRNESGNYTCEAANQYGNSTVNLEVIVQYGPSNVSLYPSNITYTVQENQSIGPINCSAQCFPKCEYEWIGPGISVPMYPLYLSRIHRGQTGQFICNASNIVSDIQKAINIVVQYGPSSVSLSTNVSSLLINEGQLLGPVTCTADCFPVCIYKWSGPSISEDVSILQINNIQRNRNGTYTCEASNQYGNTKVNLDVIVQYGPSNISFIPSNMTYTVQENRTIGPINCSAQCFPKCRYEWTGPGILLPMHSLYLSSIQRGQTGQFVCNASNIVSDKQLAISVVVQYGPSSVSQSMNKSFVLVNEGQQVGPVTCKADCVPDCTYRWIGPDLFENVSTFHINNINRKQNGTYTCEATNQYAKSTVYLDVIVQYGPSDIIFNPSNMTYTVQENQTLGPINCSAQCFPKCKYEWTGPGLSMPLHPLFLGSLHRGNTGLFICNASNIVSDLEKAISVVVQYAAKVQYLNITGNTFQISETSNVILSCNAEGYPPPNLSWYFVEPSGWERKIGNIEQSIKSEYRISTAECTDTGTYTCKADNSLFPPHNVSKLLNVTCSPRLLNNCSMNSPIAVKRDTNVAVSVCYISNPTPNVNWTVWNVNETDKSSNINISFYSNSSILHTTVLETKLTYRRKEVFTVVAVNSFGQSTSKEYEVVIEDIPYRPINVSVSCAEKNTLYWTSNFNGGRNQTFVIYYRENNTKNLFNSENITDKGYGVRMEKDIMDLLANTIYDFRVFARNEFGNSSSENVHCWTAVSLRDDRNDQATIIGGAAGSTLAVIFIGSVIILHIYVRKRNGNKGTDENRRKILTTIKTDVEDDDGLHDNILYQSASSFIAKDGSEVHETVLYAEAKKLPKEERKGEVYVNALSATKKVNKTEYNQNQDVYENMDTVENIGKRNLSKNQKNKDGLQYAELVFSPLANGSKFVIRGLEDRTVYAQVDTSQKIDPLPDSDDEDQYSNSKTSADDNME